MGNSKLPIIINEKAGIKLYCSCGRSKKMPYCDGISHKNTGMKPYRVEIEEDMKVSICTCGKSLDMPFCDGAHQLLS